MRFCLRIAALALLAGVGAQAQQPLFTSGIELVQLGVTVVGRDGTPLTVFTRDDFEVYEDGELQEIRYFARGLADDAETVPTHLGVLFDTSASMERDARFAKTAAIKFLNTLTYAEDMTVVDFDTEVRVGRYERGDFPRLVERIRSSRTTGDTALYDALGVYLDGAFAQDGRKVLLLYTDGADTRSRTTRDDVVDFVRASDVTIYAIGFQKQLPSSLRPIERMRLQQLADMTGGRSYFPDRVEDLDEIYEQIAAELDARYSLGYVSGNPRTDGSWREIEVKLPNPPAEHRRLRVRARKGYFAPYLEPEPQQ
ncbi:MAG: VWA domain-containing protein [Acidobacteria bacterium]|nr:VWA domain-containing protein [Acidobacteriota bacterium]